ncbi:MAG: hypothetical protein HYY30_00895 [Chloroflexi bacterium]|nr:hypothetical protein [Chloroflexota bacterium]
MDDGYAPPSRRVRPAVRWLARILSLLGALLSAFIILGLIGELRGVPMPFVLDGAPFGTYAQPTQLSLLTFGVANTLFLLGAILAFRSEAAAGGILLFAGIAQIFLWFVHLLDPTFPRGNLAAGLALAVLPPLIIGGLFLTVARAPRPRCKSGDDPSVSLW